MRTFAEQKEAEREMRREWLRSIVKSGMRPRDMERELGCDRSSVGRMARELGVEMMWVEGTKPNTIDADSLLALIRAGRTRREMAIHFGVSYQGIRLAIMRNGFVGVEKTVKERAKSKKKAPKSAKPSKDAGHQTLSPLEQMKLDAQAANKRLRSGG